jgi:hypothetical protein
MTNELFPVKRELGIQMSVDILIGGGTEPPRS